MKRYNPQDLKRTRAKLQLRTLRSVVKGSMRDARFLAGLDGWGPSLSATAIVRDIVKGTKEEPRHWDGYDM